MKKLTLFSLLIVITTVSFAQAQMAKFYYEKGSELYEEKLYDEAIEQYEKALEKNENHKNALCYLGYSYQAKENPQKALTYFQKLQNIDDGSYWAWYLFEKGKVNEELENWDAAAEDYRNFIKLYPKNPTKTHYIHRANCRLSYVLNVEKIRSSKSNMEEPKNLGKTINTISADMMPQINPTGDRLYFTSERKGGFDDFDKDEENDWGEDIYFTNKEGSNWGKPILLPEPINSYDNDGTSTFSADGQQMIYVKCGDDGVGSCDLFTAILNGDKWEQPQNLGNVVNSEEWDSQPTLSSDGNSLIFVSSRVGSYDGSMDLYMSIKNKAEMWGPAQNLGPTINTPFGEKSPYLAPDGKTLYFSSIGHSGYGDYDIFVSVFEEGKWTDSKNLGAPLNSSGEDTYFTISASGEGAYFASNRSGEGGLDLFSVSIPEALRPKPSIIVRGVVTNAKSSSLIDAWVLVEDINTGELIATAKSNSLTGKYLVVLPSGRNYSVSANKEGFFFYSNKFEVPETAKYEEIKKDIALKPIEKGARVVLNNIFFETGKATLTQESYIELGKAVALLNANRKMVVEVGGHTDNVGSDLTNMKLSHERAKSVRTYLVKSGISSERLQAKGYGETQPVAENETEEGRKANRRTEFVILEN
ncbi:MAG: PD40 domain-containing protein [Flavobacteriales bacterium]|nr:PD40 domain-containing protein [Flavobacteriales bacterium]